MPQKIVENNGVKKLQISVSVRCKEHPNGRIQLKRVYEDVEINSNRAKQLEKELVREAEKEKTTREIYGVSWKVLLNLYGAYSSRKLNEGKWCQSRQTYDEAISALYTHTAKWDDLIAAKITAADITRLLHNLEDSGYSNSSICKLKGDIKKVYEFGILENHLKGISVSPTNGVSIKSRRRMRTEILREDEIQKLLTYSQQYEPVWYFIWAFAIYTGARNGELFALKWIDIDEKDRMITIQRSYNKKYDVEKCTKTGDWRKVSICEPLWDVIVELKRIRDHDIQRGETKYSEFVLPRPGVWQNGEQARKLRMFCEEIGITPICFHTLRACFATELLKRGVPTPAVMRVGGWKSLKTMMHYVRLSAVEDKGITSVLDFRKPDPNEANRILMNAVGDAYNNDESLDAIVIPLNTRRLPRFMK